MPDPQPTESTIPRQAPVSASIIIVNYNGQAYLSKCIDSLHPLAGPDVELIVVDNGSTDSSASEVAIQFPEVRVIFSATNLGFGGANNLAAKEARGRYLVFLNPDTLVAPGWLAALIDTLEADPQLGMSTSKILLLDDPQQINAAANEMHLTGLTLCRGLGQPAHLYNEPIDVTAVSGASFAIRRDLFHRLGGFDESYFMYFEDSDLSLAARLAGYRCRYVPDSVVYHDYRLHFGPLKTYYEERNRYTTLLKTYHWHTLLLLLPALFLAEIVTWGYVLLGDRPRWRNKLRAYRDILLCWPAIVAKRRRLQALRQVSDRQLLAPTTTRLDYGQTEFTWAAQMAHLLFDLPFRLWKGLLMAVIHW